MVQINKKICFDHILLPVDGSEHSLLAIDAATNLFQSFGSRITVIGISPTLTGVITRSVLARSMMPVRSSYR